MVAKAICGRAPCVSSPADTVSVSTPAAAAAARWSASSCGAAHDAADDGAVTRLGRRRKVVHLGGEAEQVRVLVVGVQEDQASLVASAALVVAAGAAEEECEDKGRVATVRAGPCRTESTTSARPAARRDIGGDKFASPAGTPVTPTPRVPPRLTGTCPARDDARHVPRLRTPLKGQRQVRRRRT